MPSLTEEEARLCLEKIFRGELDAKQVLLELTESVDEIVGFARAMRAAMVPVHLDGPVLDNCGTGGVPGPRFNASTASAFVLAAGGVKVAKHGNRGSREPNGSFDFLDALEIKFDLSVPQIEALFKQTGLCFLFARNHHPAMAKVASVRKEIGRRTIFNLLGPLCNPAGAQFQILGTTNEETAYKLAQAVQRLGTERSLIVWNESGIDEFMSTSLIFDVAQESIRKDSVKIPELSGSVIAGNAQENAAIFKTVFSKKDVNHPISQYTCLNAGAGFYCYGKVGSITEGYNQAKALVESGEVWAFFTSFRKLASEI